ncbi:MAG TPA: hypothetical protein VFG30_29075 [Polyangiales bacterium]|nr:hypothetical protein [Polyangiales bacterium]
MRAELLIRTWCPLLVALGLSLHASSAAALELRLGLKGGLTLSGLISADPSDIDLAPWHDSAVGAGFGGGLYTELHFNRLIALELDVLIEGNRLFFESYSANTAASYLEQAVVYEQLRLPLLFKLVAHLGKHVEFTGGLGPEFLFGLGATPHSLLYPLARSNVLYGADEQFGLALSAAFGLAFTTKYLHIPLEMRFGYNMLGAYSYRDRVEQYGNQIFVLNAVENFQFGFMIGFGFRIPPETPPKPPKPVLKTPEIDDPFYYPEPPEGAPPRVRRPW